MDGTYNLVLDKDVIARYDEHYFDIHKRAKKSPIMAPRHPSLNVWTLMPRTQANDLKRKWLDFIVWWVNDLGYSKLNLEKVRMRFKTYMPTKRRADPDNTVPKYILDGLVESGMIMDDDYTHIQSLTLEVDYDNKNPRTEIEIVDCLFEQKE